MASKAEGQSAIDSLNGTELKGRALNVNEAPALAPKVAVVEEDTAVAEEDKV
jgi:hypothetical protein